MYKIVYATLKEIPAVAEIIGLYVDTMLDSGILNQVFVYIAPANK